MRNDDDEYASAIYLSCLAPPMHIYICHNNARCRFGGAAMPAYDENEDVIRLYQKKQSGCRADYSGHSRRSTAWPLIITPGILTKVQSISLLVYA